MSEDDTGDSDPEITEMKRRIQELDYQGDKEVLRRLSQESGKTLQYQLQSLNDIDSKAISILRVNVLLLGLILTAASLVADSSLDLAMFGNIYLYTGIVSLIFSSTIAALTYTASDIEVGIPSDKINEVIDSDLTEEEFELAVAQSHTRWIWFNNKTNIINAPLITLTNILLIISISNLALGVYAAVIGDHVIIGATIMWILLIIFVITSNLINQLNSVRKNVEFSDWSPW